MASQTAAVGKLCRTGAAFEGLLTRVDDGMCSQMAKARKLLSTLRTNVGDFGCRWLVLCLLFFDFVKDVVIVPATALSLVSIAGKQLIRIKTIHHKMDKMTLREITAKHDENGNEFQMDEDMQMSTNQATLQPRRIANKNLKRNNNKETRHERTRERERSKTTDKKHRNNTHTCSLSGLYFS